MFARGELKTASHKKNQNKMGFQRLGAIVKKCYLVC